MMNKHEFEHLFLLQVNRITTCIESGSKVATKTAPYAGIAITLVDLAAVHGVSSGMIDYALVLVNSRQPPTHTTRHLAVACNITNFDRPHKGRWLPRPTKDEVKALPT